MSDLNNGDTITDAIAVVAMECRLPGAENVEAFWDNIAKGKETISYFSNEELLAAGVSKDLIDNPKYVKARGIISNIEMFHTVKAITAALEVPILSKFRHMWSAKTFRDVCNRVSSIRTLFNDPVLNL